jgi:hypothetical protein
VAFRRLYRRAVRTASGRKRTRHVASAYHMLFPASLALLHRNSSGCLVGHSHGFYGRA